MQQFLYHTKRELLEAAEIDGATRLQIEADGGNRAAVRVLHVRKSANPVLATVLWGNDINNVLLTLLSNSVLTGFGAFVFSAVAITLLGEIFPQAYFSRNALAMAARFLPFLNFYRVLLYPVAKPTALLLDGWLGAEGITYLHEQAGGDRGKAFPRSRRYFGVRRG